MKKILIILILLVSCCFGFELNNYYKLYPINADNLDMIALNALSSNDRYNIYEIQTKNGYILFSTNAKFYLLTVTKRYQNQTEIKVLPQNSDFSDTLETVKTVFNLIDLETKRTLELVK